jgi:5,10-methylenetetrahydromethanopterin reductase
LSAAVRLGVALRDLLPPAGTRAALPVRAMVDLAARADHLGYDSVWLPEGRGREAFAQLGAMAVATRRAQLATGIMPVFSRPPALAAMGLATLDDLSGGRLIFGIGAGHPAISERGYGLPVRHPVTAVREFVEIVRRAMRGETVRYEGRVFRVESFTLESVPARVVPVFIAALRGRMLALAGELADGVLLNWTTPEHARAAAGAVRTAAQASGRRPEDVTVACFIRACVTARPEAARAVLRRIIASYAGLPAYRAMWAEAGFAAEMAAAEAAAPAGFAALLDAVSDRMVDALGLIGAPEAVRGRLDAFRQAGVALPIVYPFAVESHDRSYRETIDALAPV